MTNKMEAALRTAAQKVGEIDGAAAVLGINSEAVASIAKAMPAPLALESLWPQMLRYAITIGGSVLVGRGLVTAADLEIIAGAALALAPPLYRTASTWLARRAS